MNQVINKLSDQLNEMMLKEKSYEQHWIKYSTKLNILKNKIDDWHYYDAKGNPADLITPNKLKLNNFKSDCKLIQLCKKKISCFSIKIIIALSHIRIRKITSF